MPTIYQNDNNNTRNMTRIKQILAAFAISICAISLNAEVVYICNGPQSKRFHSSASCMGLSSCSTAVKAVDKAVAKAKGRTPCKRCYGSNLAPIAKAAVKKAKKLS